MFHSKIQINQRKVNESYALKFQSTGRINIYSKCLEELPQYRIRNLENLFEVTFEMKGAKVTKDLKTTTVKGLLDKGLTMTVLTVL